MTLEELLEVSIKHQARFDPEDPPSEFSYHANPSVVRALVAAVRAGSAIRKRSGYPEVGVGLTERRLELLVFDSAMDSLNEALEEGAP